MKVGIVAVLFAGWLALPSQAALEFSGYMKMPGDMRFVLTDSQTGQRSELLKIGDAFVGHRIVAFDSAEERLTVQGPAGNVRLSLKHPKVRDSNWDQIGERLTINISADGIISHNGTPLGVDSLRDKFRGAAVDGWLFVHVKPGRERVTPAVRRTMVSMMKAFGSSGVLGRIIWDDEK